MFRHVIVYIYVGVDFDNTMYTYYCIWYLHNAKLQGFSIKKYIQSLNLPDIISRRMTRNEDMHINK